MNLTMTPRASRGLAFLILLALIAVFYFGAIAPLLERHDAARGSLTQLQAALERYQRVGRELAPRQAKLAALKQQQVTQVGFLEGASETLLAAQIQNRVKGLVEQAHGELQSTQVLPAVSEGKLRRIAVRGHMLVTLSAAQRIFYGLESATPLLFLDNVDMHVQIAGRQPGELSEREVVLDITFDVDGYSRGAK